MVTDIKVNKSWGSGSKWFGSTATLYGNDTHNARLRGQVKSSNGDVMSLAAIQHGQRVKITGSTGVARYGALEEERAVFDEIRVIT